MKTQHSSKQNVEHVHELGDFVPGRYRETVPIGPALCTLTIEYERDEFKGEAKWMWALVLALLAVIQSIQDRSMSDPDRTLEHAWWYLRSQSPEAATLLQLIVDAERKK